MPILYDERLIRSIEWGRMANRRRSGKMVEGLQLLFKRQNMKLIVLTLASIFHPPLFIALMGLFLIDAGLQQHRGETAFQGDRPPNNSYTHF